MIHSFRPNKDTLLFNIKNIPLHLFNFIFIHLQKGGYTPYYIKNLLPLRQLNPIQTCYKP